MLRRSGRRPALALGLSLVCVVITLANPATAETAEAGAAVCERAIAGGAQRGQVPTGVLHAISLTETGRKVGGRLRPWPWAINREGKGYWFGSREEALAFARQSLAEGRRSFDVGCFQINYYWHGANFATLEAMFDPDTGADYAARFLTDLYRERGDWSLAAGAYHSQTPDKAQVYRARFDRIHAGLGEQILQAVETPAPEVPKRSRTRLKGPKIITLPPKGSDGRTTGGMTAGMRRAVGPQFVANLAR